MQEAQPFIPAPASVDIKQPQPSGVAQPFIPPTASVNIKQSQPSAASQPGPSGPEVDELNKTMSCIAPTTEPYCCPISVPQRCSSADATMDTLTGQEYRLTEEGPEVVEESQGAAGDAYRFRYSIVSPEEGYSPIAGISPFRKPGAHEVQARHVWVSHEDADGAICSKPIYGPLAIVVRATDGSDHNFQVRVRHHLTTHLPVCAVPGMQSPYGLFHVRSHQVTVLLHGPHQLLPARYQHMLQVVDGMCVKNLKAKIWNMTGVSPSNQYLVMSNGAAAEDSMEFAGSGMQQGEILYLRTV